MKFFSPYRFAILCRAPILIMHALVVEKIVMRTSTLNISWTSIDKVSEAFVTQVKGGRGHDSDNYAQC